MNRISFLNHGNAFKGLLAVYSFNTNSKSKKIAKTTISIHFKVRNCQVVLPLNVTKHSSEDCTGLG